MSMGGGRTDRTRDNPEKKRPWKRGSCPGLEHECASTTIKKGESGNREKRLVLQSLAAGQCGASLYLGGRGGRVSTLGLEDPLSKKASNVSIRDLGGFQREVILKRSSMRVGKGIPCELEFTKFRESEKASAKNCDSRKKGLDRGEDVHAVRRVPAVTIEPPYFRMVGREPLE